MASIGRALFAALPLEQRHSRGDGQSELLEGPDLLCIQCADVAGKRLAAFLQTSCVAAGMGVLQCF